MYFLGRMQPPPGQRSQRLWVAAGSFALCFGIVLLGESASPGRLASLTLIVAGIVGLKLATP